MHIRESSIFYLCYYWTFYRLKKLIEEKTKGHYLGPCKSAQIGAHNLLLRHRCNPQAAAIHDPSHGLQLVHCGCGNAYVEQQYLYILWPQSTSCQSRSLHSRGLWQPQSTSCRNPWADHGLRLPQLAGWVDFRLPKRCNWPAFIPSPLFGESQPVLLTSNSMLCTKS